MRTSLLAVLVLAFFCYAGPVMAEEKAEPTSAENRKAKKSEAKKAPKGKGATGSYQLGSEGASGPEKTGAPKDPAPRDYPKKSVTEPKGTGKASVFDEGKPKGPEHTGVAPSERAGAYPSKNLPAEPKGTAKATDFATTNGVLPYPKTDKNPADNVPMQKREIRDQAGYDTVTPPQPPTDLCPLGGSRLLFQDYNRHWRKAHLRDVMKTEKTKVLWTRDRLLKKPVLARGSLTLLEVFWDEAKGVYAARVAIPAGFVCEAGDYVVYQDDSVIPHSAVLEIDPSFVLLRIKGQLAYWPASKTDIPVWRLVWDSGVEVRYNQTAGANNVKSTGPTAKPLRNTWNPQGKDSLQPAETGSGDAPEVGPSPVQQSAEPDSAPPPPPAAPVEQQGAAPAPMPTMPPIP